MLGPIDYIAVGFKGNDFDGSILRSLSKAVEDGVIRVVDLLFVIKDENGEVAMAAVEDQDEELQEVASSLGLNDDMPLLTEDDIDQIGDTMENNTSAGVLVIEQLWAKDLKRALQEHDAFVIEEGRIHPEVAEAAAEELKAVG